MLWDMTGGCIHTEQMSSCERNHKKGGWGEKEGQACIYGTYKPIKIYSNNLMKILKNTFKRLMEKLNIMPNNDI